MSAFAMQTPKEWFPAGRNPWTDIYTPRVLERIGEAIGGCTDQELDRLGCEIARAAEFAVTVEDETSVELTKSKRIEWVRDNLLQPLRLLRRAIAPENARMTSLWPYSEELSELERLSVDWFDHDFRLRNRVGPERTAVHSRSRRGRAEVPPSMSKRQKIEAELEWLEDWAAGVVETLKGESRKPITAARDAFVIELVRIYRRHFPDRDQAGHRPSGVPSLLSEFVIASARPVLGISSLSRQIKLAVSRVPAPKAKKASTGRQLE